MNKTLHDMDSPHALQLEVWKRPLADIAREYGIPLRKLMIRVRAGDINLPPPEYWRKLESGLSRFQVLKEIGWTMPMIRKMNEVLKNAKARSKQQKKKV